MNEEKKQKSSNKWKYFKRSCLTVFIVLFLITLKASFYFTGPLKVKVIDAKTDEPIEGIKVELMIYGDIQPCISAGGCIGWDDDSHKGYTDKNGVFKTPLSISKRIPFLQWLDSERKLWINDVSDKEERNKDYDNYEHKFTWFPFRSFELALVPTPETLEDCRDLTEEEQYRCVKSLAIKDANVLMLSEYYIRAKYNHILSGYCDDLIRAGTNLCKTVKAVKQKDKNICDSKESCLFSAAIDLKDKSWCEMLPERVNVYSREECKDKIDKLLTAEEK